MRIQLLTISFIITAFTGLSQADHFVYRGDAYLDSSNTSAANFKIKGANQTGGAWFAKPLNLDTAFRVTFLAAATLDRNLEGFAFVLREDIPTDVGPGDSLLGVPLGTSLVIEFDFQVTGSLNDPLGMHAAIFQYTGGDHFNSSLIKDTIMAIPFNPSEVIDIRWEPDSNSIQLSRMFCNNELLTYTIDIKNDVFSGQSQVFGGFTAATSDQADSLLLGMNYVTHLKSEDTVICAGEVAHLYSGTFVNTWGSSESYSITPNEYVAATPTQTAYYYTDISAPCGDFRDSILVTVIDTAIVDHQIIYDPNTNKADVELEVLGGTAPVITEWSMPDGSVSHQEDLLSVMPGDYQLTITTGNLCSISRNITVNVTSVTEVDYFSPNGDGQDEGIIITVKGESEIVNSAGLVLRVIKEGDLWDGTDQYGVLQPSGVYLVIGDNSSQTITLLR